MHAVGFIGTGLLGAPMAERLAESGRKVVAWNRTLRKAEPLREAGVEVAADPARVFEAADPVLLMLADAAAIEDVLFQRVGADRLAGKTVVQMGTIGPRESLAFRDRLQEAGARWVEAPVMGSIPEAEAGQLTVMVGCEPSEMDALAPILDVFGPVYRIGAVGSAATLKLALNHLIAAHATAFSASLAVVRRGGLDPSLFMTILRRTNLHAPLFDKKLPRMRARRYDAPHFPAKHLLKDARLFRETAAEAGVPVHAVDGVLTLLRQAVDSGLGDLDYAAVYEALDPLQPG